MAYSDKIPLLSPDDAKIMAILIEGIKLQKKSKSNKLKHPD